MSASDWITLVAGLGMAGLGIYMIAAPRRLFMRSEDPPAYRPETVEYDSEHGRWLRTRYGPMLILLALVFLGLRFI